MFMVLFQISSSYAQEYTTINATYHDIIYHGINIPTAIFSTKIMNESKYFVIYCDGNIKVSRFDSSGALEETRTGDTCSWVHVSRYPNIFFWSKGNVIFASASQSPNSILIYKFNITEYTENSSLTGIHLIYNYTSVGTPTYVDVSNHMIGGYSPNQLNANFSIAVAWKENDGSLHVIWDFYDPESSYLHVSDLKREDITTIQNLGDFYVEATNGNCFLNSDCIFHFLYEGESPSNSYNRGIYNSECRIGLFGFDCVDKGLIGYTTPAGFAEQISGINRWTYNYRLGHKIFFRAIQNDNIFYIQNVYDEDWVRTGTYRINSLGSNAFMPLGVKMTKISEAHFEAYGLQLQNQTFLYLVEHGSGPGNKWYLTQSFDYLYGRVTVTDYYNASNQYVYQVNFGDSVAIVDFFFKVQLPSEFRSKKVNITLQFLADSLYIEGTHNAYIDISYDLYELYAVQDVNTESPSFAFRNHYVSGYTRFINTNIFGFQTVQEACVCTDWSFQGCYNTTHAYYTRLCYPSGCADEILFSINKSCGLPGAGTGAPPGSTPTVPSETTTQPIINYTTWYNITGNEPASALLTFFSTPGMLGLMTFIIIAGSIGYITKSGLLSAVSLMIGIFILGFYGYLPFILVVLLTIFEIIIIVWFLRNSFFGG